MPSDLHRFSLSTTTATLGRCLVELACLVTPGIVLAQWQPRTVPAMHYPRFAQLGRIEGTVVAEATVAEDGQVTGVVTTPAKGLLPTAVADSVRAWRFKQSGNDGVNLVRVTFDFQLRGDCDAECCDDEWVFDFPDHVLVRAKSLPLNPETSATSGSKQPEKKNERLGWDPHSQERTVEPSRSDGELEVRILSLLHEIGH